MIIARVLSGLKSSGAAWRAKLAETMRSLDYVSSQADPDVGRQAQWRGVLLLHAGLC